MTPRALFPLIAGIVLVLIATPTHADTSCTPATVDDTVYSVPVGPGCTALDMPLADYTVVADEIRDDDEGEQLIVVRVDQDPATATDVLKALEQGQIDGHLWYEAPLP